MDYKTEKRVEKWLDLAKHAPSGGNAQPWLVEYDESPKRIVLRLGIDPEYRPYASPLDVAGSASAVALGCFSKNLIYAAQNDQFHLQDKSFINGDSLWKTRVDLVFEKSLRSESDVSGPAISQIVIQERHTDRYPYKKQSIAPEDFKTLENILQKTLTVKSIIVDHGDSKMKSLLAALESVRWQSHDFLQSLFSEIGFNPKEDRYSQKIPSFQLGISKMDELLLKTLKKYFSVALFLMRRGLSRIAVAKSVSTFVNQCDKMIFLQAAELNFVSCFDLGMCFQELWLQTQARNISGQPNGNGLLALAYWSNPADANFTAKHTSIIKQVTHDFAQFFGLDLKRPVVGFRFGYPTRKSFKSPRKKVQAVARSEIKTKTLKKESA